MLDAILPIFGTGLVHADISSGHGMMARQAAHPAPGQSPGLLARSAGAAWPPGDRQRPWRPTHEVGPQADSLRTRWASVHR